MLLSAGIGAFFLLVQVVTAQRFAPLMPERMVTHWGPTATGFGPTGYMAKCWGLAGGASNKNADCCRLLVIILQEQF